MKAQPDAEKTQRRDRMSERARLLRDELRDYDREKWLNVVAMLMVRLEDLEDMIYRKVN